MSRETLSRILRRAAVLAATGAVIGVAVFTVQVAAAWRAESAPLDVAPAAMSTIEEDADAEAARTETLAAQIDEVGSQLTSLQGALLTAKGAMSTDTENATALQAQLAEAKAKLEKLQGQLKGAQARLAALNRAASRQAALNAAARRYTAPAAAPAAGGGEPDDD